MFQCANCGSPLIFDPKSQKMVCRSCNSFFDPNKVTDDNYSEEEGTFDAVIFTCPSCGGELTGIDGSIAASFCPYCGQPVTMKSRLEKVKTPDYIVPFKVSKEECVAKYKEDMNHWYVPARFKGDLATDSLKGIYMPYGLYEESFYGPVRMTQVRYYSVGNVDHYSEMQYDGDMNGTISDIPFDVSVEFDDAVSVGIQPFNLKKAVPFKPQYLSGYYADAENDDITKFDTDAADIAYELATENVKKKIAKKKDGHSYHTHSFNVDAFPSPDKTRVGRALFPTWFMTVKTRDGGVAYAVQNAQTGTMFTDVPVSIAKYSLVSAVLGLMIFVLLTFIAHSSMSIEGLTVAVLALTFTGSIITNCLLAMNLKRVRPFKKSNEHKALNAAKKVKSRFGGTITAGFLMLFFLVGGSISVTSAFVGVKSAIEPFAMLIFAVLLVSVIVSVVYSVKIRKNGGSSGYAFVFSICSALSGMALMFNKTVDDLPHFMLGIVTLILMVLSFMAAMNENNKRVFIIPPQFATHKGGTINDQ